MAKKGSSAKTRTTTKPSTTAKRRAPRRVRATENVGDASTMGVLDGSMKSLVRDALSRRLRA